MASLVPRRIREWFRDRHLRRIAEAHAEQARLDFASVECFALFVGPRRSGSTLVSQIMNLHPEVIVSHELDAPERVRRKWDRDMLFGGILARDQELAAQGADDWLDQDFMTPGSFAGDYQHLRVVGDKASALSTGSLLEHAELWDRFQELLGVPVHVVQNVRNPFDNIARLAEDGIDVREAASDYFDQLVALRVLESRCDSVHTVPIEVLISVPELTVRELCSFLGVEASEDFVEAGTQHVVGSLVRPRDAVDWPVDLRTQVESTMAAFPQLARYSFDA